MLLRKTICHQILNAYSICQVTNADFVIEFQILDKFRMYQQIMTG